MITLKQCVIVEGKYDQQKLEGLIDATILSTNGFRIFQDREKRLLIKRLAAENGLIILTDSDSAGFLIRNHIKGLVPPEQVTHLYIPEILGKEKRKAVPSKEGLLGVEGMDDALLLEIFRKSGINAEPTDPNVRKITKYDLYETKLSGSPNSNLYRKALLRQLNLPQYITTNALLQLLNTMMNYDRFAELANQVVTDLNKKGCLSVDSESGE